ncbi:hypothetical protein ACCO45_012008 [Purpureocillium lilacinum]|uniref:Uncharacterized protein n=1 Tax=Purpureocillium lilacinum TaxID=33203 RepID=A0ACC4DCI0_PURLI
MKRREYRSLLPAEDNSDQQFFQTSPLSKKPRNLRIACDACRVKKVAHASTGKTNIIRVAKSTPCNKSVTTSRRSSVITSSYSIS